MKNLLLSAILVFPALSLASYYSCAGEGFDIEIGNHPLVMSVSGNGFNSRIQNLNSVTTFDTTISGNSLNPAATIKLLIKDSSFANPGDSFRAGLTVTTPTSVREYAKLICLRGNEL